MSLLTPVENFIHKLDTEAAAELGVVKAEAQQKLDKIVPVFDQLGDDLKTAVTDAVEQAAPGLRAALTAALTAARAELTSILLV
jgi:hypothetical protein